MKRAARVLFVITTLDVGGAEKHLLWLARGLLLRGFHVDVAYLKGEGSLAPEFLSSGAAVTKVRFERKADAPATCLRLAALMRRGRHDIVHTHLLKADALGALAALLARPGAVVASKHNEEQALRGRVVSRVHGVLCRVPRRIIALSDHVLEYTAASGRAPRDRLRRVYYGIDPSRFESGARERARARLGVSEATHVALCIARFHPQKDHATLFRAAARLCAAGLDFRLLLAGGDPFYGQAERLRVLAAGMGLCGTVDFLGIRDDIPDLLAACDLFVLPSLYEGLGLVFLEAMAASRPVLATRTAAIPEVVAHGATGLLVEKGDDRQLAASWLRLMADRDESRRMGEAGRARVLERFGLARMVDEIIEVYREALGSAAFF
ncbi:MAG: glycosyltransferase [Planctomycetes bacterium]|nr:glycosyltransferase [Planctomycetota bacterium]